MRFLKCQLLKICFILPHVLWADLKTVPRDTMVELMWDLPSQEIQGFMLRRSTLRFPQTPQEGDLVYLGKSTALLNENADRGLTNGMTYFYTLFIQKKEEGWTPWLTEKAVPQQQAVPDKNVEGLVPIAPALPNKASPNMMTTAKEWDFTKGFDPQEWRVGKALNSYHENLFETQEGVKLVAWGNQAGKRKKTGVILFSREFFGSGRYDFWAKIGPAYNQEGEKMPPEKFLGCAFTVWNFHFLQYEQSQPQWHDQPSPIRNSEIDWETPIDFFEQARQNNLYPFCPSFSWSRSRLSTYGGQLGGEEVRSSILVSNNHNLADEKIHQYTVIWNAGIDHADGSRTPGYVEWYLDTGEELNPDHRLGRIEGTPNGFDEIPYRAMHIAVSASFPEKPKGLGPPHCSAEGWAGTADWLKAEFTVSKIRYTPLFPLPLRDRWEEESPSIQYWTD